MEHEKLHILTDENKKRIRLLIDKFKEFSLNNPFNGNEEIYKWKLVNKLDGAGIEDIIKEPKKNLVYEQSVPSIFKSLLEKRHKELINCVENLFNESTDLDTRIENYYNEMKDIGLEGWKNFANDERTAATLLSCKYPGRYTFYLFKVYKKICLYLGLETKDTRKCYSHFMSIINIVSKQYGKEIQDIINDELEDFKIKPEILATQTLFWCMQDFMDNNKDMNIKDNTTSDMLEKDNSRYGITTRLWKDKKNIILYGAPGTGKTFDIPEYVVRLCYPHEDINALSRNEIVMRYRELKKEKRVVFTTFHQSMDYEDWMEGLRPEVDSSNQLTYNIEDGIFKRLCIDAERPIINEKNIAISRNASVWKVSLCGTGDNPVRTDCMKNGYIRIGWDGYGENINEETDWSIHNGEGKYILDTFINKMKEGDIIMSCYSNKTIDAIGVVTGGYVWRDDFANYKRTRKVDWLIKGINEDIVDMNDGKTMVLGTVYKLNAITLDNVKTILDKYKKSETMSANTKPFVMVIDEINRGNVSSIFGELITLLESDKRKGKANEETVMLPYSKKSFSVPDNVYIIATMNTADRSLGSLDYAIRRRFAFIQNRPYIPESVKCEEDLFKEVSSLFISNYEEYSKEWNRDIKLQRAETLSEEYRPEDVWIGHSYFINDGKGSIKDRLLYEVIPLLEDYVRDGILTGEAQETIDKLYITATE